MEFRATLIPGDGIGPEVVEAAVRVNARERARMIDKIVTALDGEVAGKTVGVLRLSFKPETDDIREAPSLEIVAGLLERGAKVQAYDPAAMAAAGNMLPDLTLCKDTYEACKDADVVVIITEWNQFRMLDFERMKSLMQEPRLVDLRNIYEPDALKAAGFLYWSVGR